MSKLFKLLDRKMFFWTTGTAIILIPVLLYSNNALINVVIYYTTQVCWDVCKSTIRKI